jgi:hypothetical protein
VEVPSDPTAVLLESATATAITTQIASDTEVVEDPFTEPTTEPVSPQPTVEVPSDPTAVPLESATATAVTTEIASDTEIADDPITEPTTEPVSPDPTEEVPAEPTQVAVESATATAVTTTSPREPTATYTPVTDPTAYPVSPVPTEVPITSPTATAVVTATTTEPPAETTYPTLTETAVATATDAPIESATATAVITAAITEPPAETTSPNPTETAVATPTDAPVESVTATATPEVTASTTETPVDPVTPEPTATDVPTVSETPEDEECEMSDEKQAEIDEAAKQCNDAEADLAEWEKEYDEAVQAGSDGACATSDLDAIEQCMETYDGTLGDLEVDTTPAPEDDSEGELSAAEGDSSLIAFLQSPPTDTAPPQKCYVPKDIKELRNICARAVGCDPKDGLPEYFKPSNYTIRRNTAQWHCQHFANLFASVCKANFIPYRQCIVPGHTLNVVYLKDTGNGKPGWICIEPQGLKPKPGKFPIPVKDENGKFEPVDFKDLPKYWPKIQCVVGEPPTK